MNGSATIIIRSNGYSGAIFLRKRCRRNDCKGEKQPLIHLSGVSRHASRTWQACIAHNIAQYNNPVPGR